MAAMNALRRRPLLARLVLAWFVWVLGVAVASPLLNPEASVRSAMLVCSGAGSVLLPLADTDPASAGDGTGDTLRPMALDCPLCAAVAPPLVLLPNAVVGALAPGPAPWVALASPAAPRTAAPLPPRGPPLHA